MTQLTRQTVLAGLMIVALLLATGYSYSTLQQAHARAIAEAATVGKCAILADQIESLRHRPAMAGSQEMQLTEMSRRIETSCSKASIPVDNLIRINPEPARRVEETVYQEKPTSVLLKDVTLRQLVTFIDGLTSSDSGLELKSLRLSAPRGSDLQDNWSADLTLTYLIYSPRTDAGAR